MRLASLATLGLAALLSLTAPHAQAPAPAKPATPAAAPATAPAALIDINSAPKAELVAKLKGVGDVRADAIIKGRPYKGKDELYQKNIIPRAVYDDIKDQIIARQK